MELELPYKPTPIQSKVHLAKARFKIIAAGRRSGKTTLAVNELIVSALLHKGSYWYVAPTYKQAKMIAWKLIKQYLPRQLISKDNETELIFHLVNGSEISLKGADHEDSLRGVGLSGVVLDEYASMKKDVWAEIVRPMLTDTKGWAIFIGTPKGFNHFKELYDKPDPDHLSFHFKTTENPYIDSSEVEQAKRELSEDAFAQEYEADFRKYTGLVYKDFERKVHVIPAFDPDPSWARFRSIDFGFHNPTAVLFIAVDFDSNVYVYDELYFQEQTTEYICQNILTKTGANRITASYADPSAAQLIADYAKLGVYCLGATREPKTTPEGWVESGISRIVEHLKRNPVTGKPRLRVTTTCKNLIREFETYCWEEKKSEGTLRMPKKEQDHALDALRYFFVSYQRKPKVERQNVYQGSSITGYG